jgi:hypothetical protein
MPFPFVSQSVNFVVPPNEVIPTAIKLAETIIDNSPDSIRSTKRAIHEAMLHGNIEEAYRSHILSPESQAVYVGDNIKVCVIYCLALDEMFSSPCVVP